MNGFVFGRYKAWRRVLEAKPSEWRAIFADPAFRADFRQNVSRTALFNGAVAPVRVKRAVKPELQTFSGPPPKLSRLSPPIARCSSSPM